MHKFFHTIVSLRYFIVICLFGILLLATLYLPFSQNRWGLRVRYYSNTEWSGTPLVEKVDKNPYIRGVEQENLLSKARFSAEWHGYIVIKEGGRYRFTTESDDGSYLRINDELVIDNGGRHGKRKVSQYIMLERGVHTIEIQYFQAGGYNILEVSWTPPNGSKVFIPSEILFVHKPTWGHLFFRECMLRLPQILKFSWIVFGISAGTGLLISYLKKVSLVHAAQSIGLSIVSTFFFLGAAELISRLKYTPQKIDYNWIFEYDKDKLFRLKSQHTGEYGGVEITTNADGYRDAELPLTKSANAMRILALGDSVTFGHGNVLQHELYTEVLEKLLQQRLPSRKIDVVNMGCPGNSAWQEYYDLKTGLQFQPDAVLVQYTLNDVIEPYLVSKKRGGAGKDYHGVEDIPYLDYVLSQHSAFYIFLKDAANRIKFRSFTKEELRRKALEREVFQIRDSLVTYHDHPKIEKAWQEYLSWLEKIARLCRENDIPCILLISPYSFQLALDESFAHPQMILTQFAKEQGLFSIDLLAMLQADFKERMVKKHVLSPDIAYKDLIEYLNEKQEKNELDEFWHTYFIDADHYTVDGHQRVAQILFDSVMSALPALEMQ